MKTLCGFVLLLALVLPGCASSRPVDVVMRDGQRWVTVPEAGVSFPLLGVFADAPEGDGFYREVLALDASKAAEEDCAIAVASRKTSKQDGWAINGQRVFNEQTIPIFISQQSHRLDLTKASKETLHNGRCIVLGNARGHGLDRETNAYCYGANDRIVLVLLGFSKECVTKHTPDVVRMIRQMRFE